VPQVLGTVEGRVLLRQGGKVLTRLPLQIRVVSTTLTLVMGLATLVLPFGASLLRHFRLDFESQVQEGFVSYGGLSLALAEPVARGAGAVCWHARAGHSCGCDRGDAMSSGPGGPQPGGAGQGCSRRRCATAALWR
jgi:hypothetical protein